MAITINDLYSKYTEKVEQELEDDRYFQYLFEMVQAGDNTLQQKNRILHKVVDDRWISTLEEGIEAIFEIIDKPRRFLATTEEVVPVALAKKITADSVRHLSMNTQFIASDENGDIQPTKVLNVTTEESYDLYENRFVYHLIQRLFAFVDKRTDAIFWTTGDETCNVMSMESKVDDAYEEISYKVEMTIKNRQSFAENDNDNLEIFKRIDRLRRMAVTLRSSSFCSIMAGCARVQSPIQRTNLMMKDPSYRTCYKLWQFMESYDEVGYTIEERDSALEFDEEYLLQMYINLITNYTVFKSLLESDPRKMSEIAEEHREPVKPKFIKEIQEEIVEDRNIPDVEIRKVFVEEVTQAQLDAEEKLKEETARCEELSRSLREQEHQVEDLSVQMDFLEQMRQQAEDEQNRLMEELSEERAARDAAEEAQKLGAEEAERVRKELEETKENAARTEEALRQESKESLEALAEDTRKEKEALETEFQKTRESLEETARKQLEALQQKYEKELEQVKKEAEKALQEAESKKAEALKKTREAEKAKKAAKQKEAEAEKAFRQAQQKTSEARKRAEEAEQQTAFAKEQIRLAEEAKEKAAAGAGSLSRYIVNVLRERKERKNAKGD